MEAANLEFLQKNLKYLGFGTSLNGALKAKLQEKGESFTLGVTSQFDTKQSLKGSGQKDTVNYELSFKKSNATDNYFLNSMKATLQDVNNDKVRSNTFILNKGSDVTAKEAYNLLRGASIQKKMEAVNKFDLVIIGKQQEEKSIGKFTSVKEIEEVLSKLPDSERSKASSFVALDKGFPIRNYDQQGKQLPISHKDVEIIHFFKEKASGNSYLSIHDNHKSFEEAKKAIKTRKLEQPETATMAYEIRDKSTKTGLAKFDGEGKETDLTAQKKVDDVWVKLDFENQSNNQYQFKKFYGNYGFNLEKELMALDLNEMKDEKSKSLLLASLGRGNFQKATTQTGTVFIEANPQFKRLDVYDTNFERINVQQNELSRKI